MGGGGSHEVITHYVPDPHLAQQIAVATQQQTQIVENIRQLELEVEKREIKTADDLVIHEKKGSEALIKMAQQASAEALQGRNFGFFGKTSTGKSTLINQVLNENVAATGDGETTTKIEKYPGNGYFLYDIPGSNDEISYLSMEYFSLWKGLTCRIVVVKATLKEMTKVFRLLDAIGLDYDIVVNKFDLAKLEEQDEFKEKIRSEVTQCQLKGVKNIWFVSAKNPTQFPDWTSMVNYLTSIA